MDKETEHDASELGVPRISSAEPAPSAEAPTQSAGRPELQRRLERVAAYGAASLAKRNLLLAALGSANSGLMAINLYLEQALVQTLATGPLSVELLQKLQSSLDVYLRVTRQIDRFAQLEIKSKPRRSVQADDAPGGNGLKPNGAVS